MSPESMGILFAGISSILATLIYFTKNIKQSSCCGSECKQVVVDGHGDVVTSPQKVLQHSHIQAVDCVQQALDTFPQQRSAVI